MKIREADQSDFALVRQLLDSCDLYHADLKGDPAHRFLLAWEVDALIGTVGLEIYGEAALLRSLAVSPDHRRRGIAAELVSAIESYAKTRQVKTLYLLTLTASDFFAARDYRQTNREQAPAALQDTTEFKSVCPAAAACMAKTL